MRISKIAIPDNRTRAPTGYSPEHYRKHRKQLVENGTVKKHHADSTKENIYGIMKKLAAS
jgi:hypothetical protein